MATVTQLMALIDASPGRRPVRTPRCNPDSLSAGRGYDHGTELSECVAGLREMLPVPMIMG